MGRLLRVIFKLALISAVVGGVTVAAKKLMGGLGPAPGSAEAPREWPSLVPEPAAEPEAAPSTNGADPVPTAPSAGVAEPPPATDVENGPTL